MYLSVCSVPFLVCSVTHIYVTKRMLTLLSLILEPVTAVLHINILIEHKYLDQNKKEIIS